MYSYFSISFLEKLSFLHGFDFMTLQWSTNYILKNWSRLKSGC